MRCSHDVRRECHTSSFFCGVSDGVSLPGYVRDNWNICCGQGSRHLTSSQKAMVSENMLPFLEEEAKERKKRTPGVSKLFDSVTQKFGGQNKELLKSQKNDYPLNKHANEPTANAAKMTGTNRQYVAESYGI